MKHVVFALFEHAAAADAALAEALDHPNVAEDQVSVVVHRDHVHLDELTEQAETDFRPAVADGALLGVTIGAATGALLGGPAGLVAAGPLAGAILGGGAGSVLGALSSGLAGAGLPDRSLRELAGDLEQGGVLMTIATAHGTAEQHVIDILTRHGGRVVQKPLV